MPAVQAGHMDKAKGVAGRGDLDSRNLCPDMVRVRGALVPFQAVGSEERREVEEGG